MHSSMNKLKAGFYAIHRVKGADPLSLPKQVGDRPQAEQARDCGDVTTHNDGFKHYGLPGPSARHHSHGAGPRRRARATWRRQEFFKRIQFNGNAVVGAAYTAVRGVKPGDLFVIRLGKQKIQMVPAGGEPEGGSAASGRGSAAPIDSNRSTSQPFLPAGGSATTCQDIIRSAFQGSTRQT